jgi:hypothetical protein
LIRPVSPIVLELAVHFRHKAAPLTVLYESTMHAEQLRAPARLRVSWPAVQFAHASTDELLCLPAGHTVQLTAAVLVNVFVREPGLQSWQLVCPTLP